VDGKRPNPTGVQLRFHQGFETNMMTGVTFGFPSIKKQLLGETRTVGTTN